MQNIHKVEECCSLLGCHSDQTEGNKAGGCEFYGMKRYI